MNDLQLNIRLNISVSQSQNGIVFYQELKRNGRFIVLLRPEAQLMYTYLNNQMSNPSYQVQDKMGIHMIELGNSECELLLPWLREWLNKTYTTCMEIHGLDSVGYAMSKFGHTEDEADHAARVLGGRNILMRLWDKVFPVPKPTKMTEKELWDEAVNRCQRKLAVITTENMSVSTAIEALEPVKDSYIEMTITIKPMSPIQEPCPHKHIVRINKIRHGQPNEQWFQCIHCDEHLPIDSIMYRNI